MSRAAAAAFAPNSSPFYEHSGAKSLSEQPATPNKTPKDDPDWPALRSHLEARLASERNWRYSWWMPNWANLARYILPRRSILMTQSSGGQPTPNSMTRGRQLNDAIKDPTATFAAHVCAAGLMSGVASPSRPWYKVVPSVKSVQIDTAGREWLDAVENRVYTVLAKSNFYNSFAQECEDLVVFSTAPSIIYEDAEDVIRCYNPCVGEYYLATNYAVRIDALYRDFVMTVAQIVDYFGLDNCPPDVQVLWKQKGSALGQERIVAHAIEPNFEIKTGGVGKIPGAFAWREVYWLYASGGKYPLEKHGFMECPFTVDRWSTQSNDAYGRGLGMDIVPDVIQLQVMTVRLSEAIEKQVRPPLKAHISMKNRPSSSLPGSITYVDDMKGGISSIYDVNPDIRGLTELIATIQARIKTGFFNDLFLMLEQNPNQKMTAYEVAQKVQEKLQVLGPVIENLIGNLRQKLKRIFAIMHRRGMFPPMPDSMKGIALDIDFISMLALAQKASATGGLERLVALIGNMAAVYPNLKFILNEEDFIREFNDLLANPNKILRGPQEYQQMVDAAQQEQQKAAAGAAAQQGAETAQTGAQAAQVLSNTTVGAGQTALQVALSGGMQKVQ